MLPILFILFLLLPDAIPLSLAQGYYPGRNRTKLLNFCIDKNKYGHEGEVFFRYRDGAKSSFRKPHEGLTPEFENMSFDAEIEDLKMRKGR